MLFLAVFCGFFAELQLEHKIEKDRFMRFVSQLVKSLEKDKVDMGYLEIALDDKQIRFDTLFMFLGMPEDNNVKWEGIQRKISVMENPMRATRRKAAYNQMVSAGYFRLFKNDVLLEKLLDYEHDYDRLEKQMDAELMYTIQVAVPFLNRHFDKKRIPQRMGTKIKTSLLDNARPGNNLPDGFLQGVKDWKQELENVAITARERNELPYRNVKLQIKAADTLIILLKKEFHLE
jgi:hypothetical protein